MEDRTNCRPIEILLVEDNPGDVRLIKEVFKDGRVLNNINVVADGVEAISYLSKEGKHTVRPNPDLILLDLNLPRKNGRDVLAEIKNDARFKKIPVVILTSSKAEEDIVRAYELCGNCYVTKPLDLDQFMRVVKEIEEFWLNIVKLPTFPDNRRV